MLRSLLAALVLPLCAASSPVASGDEVRLANALETIAPAEIRADLFFFASPELKGRDTPSLEQRVAARFLRARLERLGVPPGAGESYFYEYPLQERRIDPERSSLTFEGAGGALALVFGRDYYFPSSADIRALDRSGALVYCGKGEREDFDKVPVKGRWALCLASDLSARRRSRYAEGAGALGVILIPDPNGSDDSAAKECARTTQYALKGLTSFHGDDDAPFPQVYLSLDAAKRSQALLGLGSGLPQLGAELPPTVRDVRKGSGTIPLENVCGFWPGSDPLLGNEVIIVSAHYDHVGEEGGQIHPGADDNGSGSMGLLALAEALTQYGPMRRSVLLMWVSGEEKGLWGSAAWTKNPKLPPSKRAVCDLNIDMIGRNAPDKLLITPTKSLKEYNGLTRLAEALGPLEGFPKLGSADEYWQRSDHMNFAVNMKIPVAFLFSDVHADYHQPSDTPDKIDYDKICRVTRLVLRMLDGLQTDTLEL
ncbi:MAG: M28 family peptidase [Planctomycetes bacterium]|nr:M28 family peptidase [Planctomycetota bacterium]